MVQIVHVMYHNVTSIIITDPKIALKTKHYFKIGIIFFRNTSVDSIPAYSLCRIWFPQTVTDNIYFCSNLLQSPIQVLNGSIVVIQ